MQARIARTHTRVREGMKAPYCTVSPLPITGDEVSLHTLRHLVITSVVIMCVALYYHTQYIFSQLNQRHNSTKLKHGPKNYTYFPFIPELPLSHVS